MLRTTDLGVVALLVVAGAAASARGEPAASRRVVELRAEQERALQATDLRPAEEPRPERVGEIRGEASLGRTRPQARTGAELPELTDEGFLPPGRHATDLASFTRRFGSTPHRARLLEGMASLLARLHEAGAAEVVIGGSFVTAKVRPGDIDLVVSRRSPEVGGKELRRRVAEIAGGSHAIHVLVEASEVKDEARLARAAAQGEALPSYVRAFASTVRDAEGRRRTADVGVVVLELGEAAPAKLAEARPLELARALTSEPERAADEPVRAAAAEATSGGAHWSAKHSPAEWRRLLAGATVVDEERQDTVQTVDGRRVPSTNPSTRLTLELETGERVRVLFKGKDDEAPGQRPDHTGRGRPEVPDHTLFLREIINSEINDELGLPFVPPTVRMTYKGQEGSAQLWVDGATWDPLSKQARKFGKVRGQLFLVFDYLIANSDRSPKNLLFFDHAAANAPSELVGPEADDVAAPVAIDNGLALPHGTPWRFWASHGSPHVAVESFLEPGPPTAKTLEFIADLSPKAWAEKLARFGLEPEATVHFLRRLQRIKNDPHGFFKLLDGKAGNLQAEIKRERQGLGADELHAIDRLVEQAYGIDEFPGHL